MAESRLIADPDVARYVAARLVSYAGSAVTYVAMPVLVYALSGSAVLTALTAFVQSGAYVVVGLPAGALADRWDRRRVMVTADVAGALVLASVPVAWAAGALSVAHVLAAGFAAQLCFVFFDAASFGALPSLVGRERLPRANGLVTGGATAVESTVPALTGVLLALVEPAPLLAVDAATLAAAALLVRAIARPLSGARAAGGTPSLRREIGEGLRYLVRHRVVRVMTAVGALQTFGAAPAVALLVVWADRELGIGAGDPRLGLVYAGWGVGSVVGSLLVGRVTAALGGPRTALVGLPVSAAMAVAVPAAPSLPVAVAGFALWGAAFTLVVVTSITLRQQATPDALMSRVNATGRLLAYGVGWSLGSIGGGVLAEVVSTQAAMQLVGCGVVAAAVLAWSSSLRSAPRDVAPSAP